MLSVTNHNSEKLNLSRKLDSISGVIIHAGKDSDGNEITYSAGGDSGYVLEFENPAGSQLAANNILAALKLRGFRYQPFDASKAVLNPAIEIGDNISANGENSIVFSRKVPLTDVMALNLSAKYDEEIDHEYGFVPRATREFRRESAYTRARLTIAEDNITAEVVRATASEQTLSGRISIAATAIEAKVSKSGGNSSSFAWLLNDSSWSLYSNGSKVLSVDSSGLTVKGNGTFTGQITATSGYIGSASSGFEIGSSYIRNGMTSLSDTANSGIFIGTNGIALGAGAFKVTSSGAVTASSVSITGGEIKGTTEMKGGKVGGVTVGTSSFGGISIPSSGGNAGKIIVPTANIEDEAITGAKIKDREVSRLKFTVKAIDEDAIDDDAIVSRVIKMKAVTDAKVTDAINYNLGYAANYGAVTAVDNASTYPSYFKAGTLRVTTYAYIQAATIAGYGVSWKYRTLYDTLGNEHQEWVLTGSQ